MKSFKIKKTSRNSSLEFEGTLEELIKMFSYTLEVGASYSHEKGNKKINKSPRTIKSLITNLNNSTTNSSMNGYSTVYYSLIDDSVLISNW